MYDTGALIAAERDDRRIWSIHQRVLARGVRPTIPAGCVIEVWRPRRSVSLSRLMEGCEIEALTAESAKRAGAMRSRASGAASAVDASVVELATRIRGAIVTSDRLDIEALLMTVRRKVQIIDI